MKITLLVSVWKRNKNLYEFFNRWLTQPEIDEILVWDNSNGELELEKSVWDDRIKIFRSPINYGCTARHILAHFAKNDNVMVACDDVFVDEGFVADLLEYYAKDTMIGVWGKNFNRDYKSSVAVISDRVNSPIEVDFVVGLIYLLDRKYLLGLNYRDMKWTCDDLNINGELKVLYPEVKRLIVPNKKWKLTEEEVDEYALYRHPDALAEKQELYERYFAK
jgi:hypothetical protein